MHLFRFSTPYPASGLIHCLHSSFAYSSSFCNAPRSHSYFLYFSSSAVNNPSPPSESALPNNDESRERRASYDNRSSSSSSSSSRKLIQPSLLASPFPDDAPRVIRRPIGRLDISDETTYVSPYSAVGNNGRRYAKNSGYYGSDFLYVKDKNIMRSWGPNARNYDRSNTREKGLERREAQNIPQRETYWSRIALLTGVGTTLLESDIRRLAPAKAHIPEFKHEADIFHVSPFRMPHNLVRRPFYSLVFPSHKAAREFVFGTSHVWLLHETPNSTIPPGCKPRLYLPKTNGKFYFENYRTLNHLQSHGGCSPGACVLFVVSGLGGLTSDTGKLPRTFEVRRMLEDSNVQFCKDDEEAGGAGLERIFFEKYLQDGTKVVDKFDGSATGAEGRWLIRCRDAAEAHRVVRDWNRKEVGERVAKFKAEILY